MSQAGPLRNLFANCPTWQAWTNARTADAAAKNIVWPAREENCDTDLPAQPDPLLVLQEIDVDYAEETGAFQSGSAEVMFEAGVPDDIAADLERAEDEFRARVEAIRAEAQQLGRTGGFLMVRAIAQIGPPQRERRSQSAFAAHYTQRLQLQWGPAP